ncbi:hypothetical protein EOM89_13760 [Candidatus Falkowbacteria bacterium]|nr:hypothetical protein [Candidatus Falkowbacteria bacterium]
MGDRLRRTVHAVIQPGNRQKIQLAAAKANTADLVRGQIADLVGADEQQVDIVGAILDIVSDIGLDPAHLQPARIGAVDQCHPNASAHGRAARRRVARSRRKNKGIPIT